MWGWDGIGGTENGAVEVDIEVWEGEKWKMGCLERKNQCFGGGERKGKWSGY